MIETFRVPSQFARQIENALIESFYEAFGKNFKDCAGNVMRNVFTVPPEANTFLKEEYRYQDFCFLRVKGVVEIDDKKAVFKLQINKYKPNYGNS